jgi:hypothetical protein
MSTATKAKTDPKAENLFEDAVKAFESSMKAGVKVQEESTRLFMDMMKEMGAPEVWQAKAKDTMEQSVEAARSNMDQAVAMMNENSATSLELLQKAMEAAQSRTPTEAQARASDLWENTLGVMRKNTQALIQANTRMLDAWSDMVQKAGKR